MSSLFTFCLLILQEDGKKLMELPKELPTPEKPKPPKEDVPLEPQVMCTSDILLMIFDEIK